MLRWRQVHSTTCQGGGAVDWERCWRRGCRNSLRSRYLEQALHTQWGCCSRGSRICGTLSLQQV